MDRESELAAIATFGDDEEAKNAMQELREKYDKTYFWCNDCDGLATKESECCLNRIESETINIWDTSNVETYPIDIGDSENFAEMFADIVKNKTQK